MTLSINFLSGNLNLTNSLLPFDLLVEHNVFLTSPVVQFINGWPGYVDDETIHHLAYKASQADLTKKIMSERINKSLNHYMDAVRMRYY